MLSESRDRERLSVLQASHSLLCERRRNLHMTIDSLELALSEMPDAAASLDVYKANERRISRERQELYAEIGALVRALALADAGGPAADARLGSVRDASAEAVLADYAELLGCGFCIPDWGSGHYELNADEQAWIDALRKQAAIDEIRITHTWEAQAGRWNLVATIAPPRHDRSYGVPKPHSNPLWQQRFERDWGQRLMIARRRVAADRAPTPGADHIVGVKTATAGGVSGQVGLGSRGARY